MIIKSKNLIIFDADAIKVEFKVGMEHDYYLMAYKNDKSYYLEGFSQEKPAKLKLDLIMERIKKGNTKIEI